jgi:hypothetical protein
MILIHYPASVTVLLIHFHSSTLSKSIGESRYMRGLRSCESPRIMKTRKTENVLHARVFSE